MLSFLRLAPSTAYQTLLLTMMATPFLQRDSCPQQHIKWSSRLNSPIPVNFSSLIPKNPKMSTFTCHLLYDHFQFSLVHGPNIPGSYAILLFTALELASHPQLGVVFALALSLHSFWSYFSTDLQ